MLTHWTRFAEPESTVPKAKQTKRWAGRSAGTRISYTYERVAGHEDAAAVFVFKYPSTGQLPLVHVRDPLLTKTDALNSMSIIPRTPSPPHIEDRDINTLSLEELKELQRRTKASKVR